MLYYQTAVFSEALFFTLISNLSMAQRLSKKKKLVQTLEWPSFQSSAIGLHVRWCIDTSVSEEITVPIISAAQIFLVKASNHLPLRNGHGVISNKTSQSNPTPHIIMVHQWKGGLDRRNKTLAI